MQPPLLNRPGMGAKLVTYYRKQDAADTGHQKLKLGKGTGTCSVHALIVVSSWLRKMLLGCQVWRRHGEPSGLTFIRHGH